jgi:tripartite-type tricarboxylate transporter receptor subunit TctC
MNARRPVRNVTGAVVIAATVSAAIVTVSNAGAQNYPDHPIQLIVPFPPAGPADVVARPLSEGLGRVLGQPIVIINKSGASGTIGAAFVAKARPDGYTLLMGTSNELTMSPGLFNQLPYDPNREFTPISTTVLFPNVLVVQNELPIYTVSDLVESTRAHPDDYSYGISGIGSTNHLTSELYRTNTGLKLHYVPYRGGAEAMTDLIGGRIQAMFATMPSSAPLINAHSVRALLVTDTKRWSAIPDVPDAAEAGVAGLKVISFNGVLAPKGTPRPIVDKLNAAIHQVMDTPEMKAQLASGAGEVSTSTPEEFAQRLKTDSDGWLAFTRQNGIHAN